MKPLFRLAWSGLFLLAASAPAVASKAVFRSFPIPTANSGPTSVIATGFGVLFTEFNANKIGFRTTDGRTIEYLIPTPNSGPMDLDIGNDGAGNTVVWFTEFLANKIGRLNPHTGEFREFAIPTAASGPHSILSNETPGHVWFTQFHGNKIGRLTTAGVFTEFDVPTTGSGPMGITRRSDTIWFTEFLQNKLGRIPIAGGPIEELTIPTPNSGPSDIALATNGRIFFTEFNAGKVGQIGHDDRTIGEIDLPTRSGGPYRICKAYFYEPDVWFTERLGNRLGVIRRNDTITEYALPAGQAEPLGCSFDGADGWFAQRTPNALGWVAHDTSVVLGAVTANGWETTLSYANAEPGDTEILAMFKRSPTYICGVCPWQGYAPLSERATGLIEVPAFGPPIVFSRSFNRAELPTLRARARYTLMPERATDLPAVRLSTISDLDSQILVFPGAARSATARSNLWLADIWQRGPFSVRVDVLSAAGDVLGSETLSTSGGIFVDLPDRFGILEVTNGQIRVTKTGGEALVWGTMTTLDGGAVVTDVGRNLSRRDPDGPEGDPLVVLGGIVGTWDTEFDVGNARAEPLNGTIGRSCTNPCPGAPVFAFTVPANGTRTLRASDIPGLIAGFASYDIRFDGSGIAPTVRARTVNRARPSQTAVLPALHLSAIRKLDATGFSFPGAAHTASGARSNLIVAETGVQDAAVLVEVFSPSGTLLKTIPLQLARGQATFLADVVRDAGGDVENAHVRVTRAGRQGSIWAILATFDDAQALSVGWGIAP